METGSAVCGGSFLRGLAASSNGDPSGNYRRRSRPNLGVAVPRGGVRASESRPLGRLVQDDRFYAVAQDLVGVLGVIGLDTRTPSNNVSLDQGPGGSEANPVLAGPPELTQSDHRRHGGAENTTDCRRCSQ